ncbi:MAG: hypothetical protein M1826_004777 [Phylliscum demangeonii]|nr:MAG: hypothetical protein M1826_004777 [Phylliscum demangeonii]
MVPAETVKTGRAAATSLAPQRSSGGRFTPARRPTRRAARRLRRVVRQVVEVSVVVWWRVVVMVVRSAEVRLVSMVVVAELRVKDDKTLQVKVEVERNNNDDDIIDDIINPTNPANPTNLTNPTTLRTTQFREATPSTLQGNWVTGTTFPASFDPPAVIRPSNRCQPPWPPLHELAPSERRLTSTSPRPR